MKHMCNGVGPQVLTTLVTTLPLVSILVATLKRNYFVNVCTTYGQLWVFFSFSHYILCIVFSFKPILLLTNIHDKWFGPQVLTTLITALPSNVCTVLGWHSLFLSQI